MGWKFCFVENFNEQFFSLSGFVASFVLSTAFLSAKNDEDFMFITAIKKF